MLPTNRANGGMGISVPVLAKIVAAREHRDRDLRLVGRNGVDRDPIHPDGAVIALIILDDVRDKCA